MSATQDVNSGRVIPVDADHRQICKAESADEELVRQISLLIRQSVGQTQNQEKGESAYRRSNRLALKAKEPKFFEVPNRRVPNFVGRADVLEELERTFSRRSSQSIAILHGMGGQGKTQVALELCNRRRSSDPSCAIFFVDASSKSSVRAGFQSLAYRLKNECDAAKMDKDAQVDFVKKELRCSIPNWLLVFDNYDNPSDYLINDFIPIVDLGDILITTRHRKISLAERPSTSSISLPGLDEESAQKLLTQAGTKPSRSSREMSTSDLNHRVDDTTHATDDTKMISEAAREITKKLGNHALAITIAAAYVRECGMALYDFLQIFDDQKKEILGIPAACEYRNRSEAAQRHASVDESGSVQHDEVPLDVWTTWELSFMQINSERGDKDTKKQLLTFLAFFGSASVSERYLAAFTDLKVLSNEESTSTTHIGLSGSSTLPKIKRVSRSQEASTDVKSESKYEISHPSMGRLDWLKAFTNRNGQWDSFRFSRACSSLRDLSLIQYSRTEGSKYSVVTLHPLVRSWIQLKTEQQEAQKVAICTAILLCSSLGRREQNITEESFLLDKNEQLLHIRGMREDGENLLDSKLTRALEQGMRQDYQNVTRCFANYLAERGSYGLSIRFRTYTMDYARELRGETSEEAMVEAIETAFHCFFAQDHKSVERITRQFGEAYRKLLENKTNYNPIDDLQFRSKRQSLFWLFLVEGELARAQVLLHEKGEVLRRIALMDAAFRGQSAEDWQSQSLYALRNGLWQTETFLRTNSNWLLGAEDLGKLQADASENPDVLRSSFSILQNSVLQSLESRFDGDHALGRLFPVKRHEYKAKKSLEHLEKVLSPGATDSREITTSRYPPGYMELRDGFLFLQAFYILRGQLNNAEDVGFHMYKMSTVTFGDDELLMKMSFAFYLVMIRRARSLQTARQKDLAASRIFWNESRRLWSTALKLLRAGLESEDPNVTDNIIPWGIVFMCLKNHEIAGHEDHKQNISENTSEEHTHDQQTEQSQQMAKNGSTAAADQPRRSSQDPADNKVTTGESDQGDGELQGNNKDRKTSEDQEPTDAVREGEAQAERKLKDLLQDADPLIFPRLLSWLQMFAAVFQSLHFARERVELGDWMTSLSEDKLGSSHPLTAANRYNFAVALHDQRRLAEAIARLEFARDAKTDTLDSSLKTHIDNAQELLRRCEEEQEGSPCSCPERLLPLPFINRSKAASGAAG